MNATQSDPNFADTVKRHAEQVKEDAEETFRLASEGETYGDTEQAPLPKRTVPVFVLFTVVFVAIYALTWTLFGGVGLVLGLLTGATAAGLAVHFYSRSAYPQSRPD